ncbi:MAG: IS21 family transposase, partial [Propionibacteriaceae bacterium]|nr:IS21 family transposase [Propionibacteriaceae bacterium]
KAGREPTLNPAYLEMAEHYGTLILPARPGRPRDKAVVEGGVLIFKRWVIAKLRNRTFHSLDELNAAILECVDAINDRTMRRYRESRRERFELIDRPAMLPLPEPFEFGEWLGPLRVPPDYHVQVHGHHYSVPYRLTQQSVHARYTPRTVEIIHNATRVASHLRSERVGEKTTDRGHMPEHHLAWADHTPERYMAWAATIGPNALAVVRKILEDARHPAGALNACSTLQSICQKHEKARFELACRKAIEIRSVTVKSIRSILQHKLEQRCEATSTSALPTHGNVRGADYYNPNEATHAE